MRILQVSSARAFGGGERHLSDLARGLAARGHELFFALVEDSPLRERLVGTDARLAGLDARNVFTLPLRNSLDLRGAVRLARLARGHEVEIIHAHVARDYTPAAFAARRAQASRLVITRHVLFPLSRAHRFWLSNASRVIAVSEAVARSLRAQKIFDPERIRVVVNGIDVERFRRASVEYEHAHDGRAREVGRVAFRVGIVGELGEVKGQEEFLRAAALVNKRLGGAVEFVIAGGDSSRDGGYRARLERLVVELGLEGRAQLLGRLGEDEVPELLASLDLFVSASRTESFGVAMAEALACGVPVVATATEGAREVVEDGLTGSLVPLGDVPALASAVAALLEDEGRRRRLSEHAREVASERFNLARMVEATERVYSEALKRESP
jgi:glycosyltransferase involved in cell wall biosynthesis